MWVKDLSIIFHNNLTINNHITYTVYAAMKNLGFIIRNCKSCTKQATLKTLLRSILEYYLEPYFQGLYSKSKENVQTIFKNFCISCWELINPYCCVDDFDSLHFRSVNSSLTFLEKLMHSQIISQNLISQINLFIPGQLSRRIPTFY